MEVRTLPRRGSARTRSRPGGGLTDEDLAIAAKQYNELLASYAA
ncbi:hypothetical protein ABZ235_40535 [Streptomyces canus]